MCPSHLASSVTGRKRHQLMREVFPNLEVQSRFELFMVGNEFVLDTNSPRWLYFSPDRFLSLGYVIEYMIINEFLDYKT